MHVKEGDVEDAFGVGAEMRPKRWILVAEEHGFIAQERVCRIGELQFLQLLLCRGGISQMAKERDVEIACALSVGKFRVSGGELVVRFVEFAAASVERRQFEERRVAKGAELLTDFKRTACFWQI